jgi:hypothetical protein
MLAVEKNVVIIHTKSDRNEARRGFACAPHACLMRPLIDDRRALAEVLEQAPVDGWSELFLRG